MNGQELKILEEKLNAIKYEVVEWKTRFEERWNAHDQRSDEIWKEIRTNISWIMSKISILPCEKHTERMKWHTKAITALWTVIIILGLVRGSLWILGR